MYWKCNQRFFYLNSPRAETHNFHFPHPVFILHRSFSLKSSSFTLHILSTRQVTWHFSSFFRTHPLHPFSYQNRIIPISEPHSQDTTMDHQDNNNVGIVSMEGYFPKQFVSQSDLEEYDKVSSGKYTIGLGQDAMSFTTEREDICSISMTVLSNLLSKNKIDFADIGWICVATGLYPLYLSLSLSIFQRVCSMKSIVG